MVTSEAIFFMTAILHEPAPCVTGRVLIDKDEYRYCEGSSGN
jgi:hypothetical protein